MTKKELQEIMERNMIMECEVDDAISFVTELLEFEASEVKRDYAYATKTIDELENAAYTVWNLKDYIEEIEDNE